MRAEAAIAEVSSLWSARSRAGGATLASWPEDDEGARHDDARALVQAIVEATRDEIAWGPTEKPAREDLEAMLGIFSRARVEAEPGILFRISARIVEQGERAFVRVRVEWTTTSQTLEDHARVRASLEAATRHVRALVQSAPFGESDVAALRAIEGVTVHALGADEAFARRTLQDDEREEDHASGRLERMLGTMLGLVYRRADFRVWTQAIEASMESLEACLAERVPSPWADELVLDLKLLLVARAFPTSAQEEAEALRPTIARVERVLTAGGVVIGVHGANLAPANLDVCPGWVVETD